MTKFCFGFSKILSLYFSLNVSAVVTFYLENPLRGFNLHSKIIEILFLNIF
jgi:hypothetical protein